MVGRGNFDWHRLKQEQRLSQRRGNSDQAEGSEDEWFLFTDVTDEECSDSDGEVNYTSSKKSRRKWSQRDKHYVCILVVTVLIIALMASLLVWQHIKSQYQPCTSEDCVSTSSYISQKMDTSTNPCTDFYQFACGSWLKNTKMPASKAKYSSFSQINEQIQTVLKSVLDLSSETNSTQWLNSTAIEKAKLYYNICMDEDTIEKKGGQPMLELINILGSWSVTGQWDEASWDIHTALTSSHLYGASALFAMDVNADDKNHSANIISFQQSGLTLQSYRNYNSSKSNYDKLHEAFLNYSTQLGKLLGGDNSVQNKMLQIWNLEKSLAEIYVPQEELLDPEKTYHKMTVTDLQKLIGDGIDVERYLGLMFGSRLNVTGEEQVLVYTPDYFIKLKHILDSTEKEVLANYIVWNLISALAGYLPEDYINAALILDAAELGISSVDPRWQRCVSKTNSLFPHAVSALYIHDKFPAKGKEEVQNIVDEVKNALLGNFPKLSWMDDATRQKAIDKGEAITSKVAYPDWIFVASELDKYYEKLSVTKGEFFKTHLDGLVFAVNRMLDRYGKPPDKTEWHMSPVEVNAYYTHTFNEIVLPAGILQQPFFNLAFPWAFNFGAIGMIIGHELTHGFDSDGRKFDKFGNLDNWWTNDSAANFNKNTQCMIDQYSQYTIEGTHIKGDLTLGENIADNGGIKAAFAAYKSFLKNSKSDKTPINLPGMDYTDDQMFFIGFGQVWCSHYTPTYAKQSIVTDPHTNSKYRVQGVLSNSVSFSQAFNCEKGSPMNPEKKCQVW